MSSKISQIIPFTYILCGVYLKHGEGHARGLSVRTVRAYLGSETGNCGRAEGLPQVQKPLLEHAAKGQKVGEMTSETRVLIEVGDISAIEIECQKCSVTSTFPISECSKINAGCPHCEKKWFDTNDNVRDKTVCPATDSLRAIASNLSALNSKTRTDIHAKIRIHLRPA